MSRRTFKERNSNRINFMILQEQAEIEAQRLRYENDQARNTLATNLNTMDVVTRATKQAFQAIENQTNGGGRK